MRITLDFACCFENYNCKRGEKSINLVTLMNYYNECNVDSHFHIKEFLILRRKHLRENIPFHKYIVYYLRMCVHMNVK